MNTEKSITTGYAVVYENQLLKTISCCAVASTREEAEAYAKANTWFMDRYQIVEVKAIGF